MSPGKQPLRWSILSDRDTWMNNLIAHWLQERSSQNEDVSWHHDADELPGGDVCFLLSVNQLVPREVRQRYQSTTVVHASALPAGKGWSPMTWQILEGNNRIPLTLLEAEDRVDSGRIYAQSWLVLQGHELADEWRLLQANETIKLCNMFLDRYPDILDEGMNQDGQESFYPRRRPEDSKLDPNKSILEQFNLLRVVDNNRYPAFFEYMGRRYIIRIEK